MAKCEICRLDLVRVDTEWAVPGRECPRCNDFRIDTVSGNLRADQEWFSDAEIERRVRLSGSIREGINHLAAATQGLASSPPFIAPCAHSRVAHGAGIKIGRVFSPMTASTAGR
jgi:hypothetical protein